MNITEMLAPAGHYKELIGYPDLYRDLPFYDQRELPSDIPLLKRDSHCQILVPFLGELHWINIARRNLVAQ